MIDVKYLLMLTCITGIGSNRLRQIISHFKNAYDVFYSSPSELMQINGISKKLAHKIANFRNTSEIKKAELYANNQLSKLNKLGGRIITYWDDDYPELLKKIFDPPAFIFTLGKFEKADRYSIAIVGTRNPTRYGISMAEKFTSELVKLGITVVSGLARGIDTIVHSTALKNNGRTLAVIGSGIDVIYPPENKNLFKRIAESGVIISEYEMGTKPDAVNFPKRNRIISGISLGTLIVETGVDGGAMITAQTAFDQNREVFAIPGLITENRSAGCNKLIKDNRAKLTTSVEDIIDELGNKLKAVMKPNTKIQAKPEPELTLFERKIFDLLNDEPTHIDFIAEKSNLSVSDVLVNLLNLEFKGVVKQLPGKMFVRI